MRVLILCAVLLGSVWMAPPVAGETQKKGPYDKVASGNRAAKDDVKVYTNEDLKKRFGIAEEEDREAAAKPDVKERGAGETVAQTNDPLAWLQQRRAAQQEQRLALDQAQKAIVAARERLANLKKQLLAARNPFAARPQLSKEEKQTRSEARETASERYQRTEKLVADAHEAVRAAEAELARLRSKRP